MAAPDYVPVNLPDRPRKSLPLPPAKQWLSQRPADLGGPQPMGRRFGKQGPDQGYALSLARRFSGRLQLTAGEHEVDVVAGCMGVAMRRASLFGRAPVIHDLELAFTLFGYLSDAPADLVADRKQRFAGAAHHYWDQRDIVDLVPEATLRMTPSKIKEELASNWRVLLGL